MDLAILNVGAGDTKLSFDPSKPVEVERSKKIIMDLLSRGFAILVQVGEKDGEPLYQRAKGFDPNTCEYLIVGDPPEPSAIEGIPEVAVETTPRRKKGSKRIPAHSTKAVAVARSAGG